MKNPNLVAWLSWGLFFGLCCVRVGAQTNLPSDSRLPASTETQNQSQSVPLERPADQIPPVPLYVTEPPTTRGTLGSGILVTNPMAVLEAQGAGIRDTGPATSPMLLHKYEFLYGLFSGAVYRDAMPGFPGDKPNTSSLLSPYVGLLGRTRTGDYLLNYTGTVMPYDTAGSPPVAFNQVTATVNGFFSRNVNWSVSGNGGFGSESARILGPLSYQVVAGLPTADSSNGILAGLNESVFTGLVNATLGWQKSAHSRFDFALTSSYTSYTSGTSTSGLPGSNRSIDEGGTITYERLISPRTTLSAFGDMFHLSSATSCTTYGGGVGIAHEASRKLSVSAEGGPQFSTLGCGGQQGFSFRGSVTMRPTARTYAYLVVNRSFSTAYRVRSTWDDNISSGIARYSRLVELSLDTTWVRGGVQPSYEGLLIGPSVRYRMRPTLSWLVGYRRFHGSSWDFRSGNMNFGSVTLAWEPRSIGFPR